MDIKQQAIDEYLEQGIGYRTLAKKYGVSRNTINKWVMIHQGIHNQPPTEKQKKPNSKRKIFDPENYRTMKFILKNHVDYILRYIVVTALLNVTVLFLFAPGRAESFKQLL